MTPLYDLAARYGISPVTRDDDGTQRPVPEAVLTGLLEALGVAATTDDDVAASLQQLADDEVRRGLPRCVTMRAGAPEGVPIHVREGAPHQLVTETEDGAVLPVELIGEATATTSVMVDGTPQLRQCRTAVLPEGLPTGYHTLVLTDGDAEHRCPLIVAPAATPGPGSRAGQAGDARERMWGLCADLYAIRSHRSWGVGDFGDLSDLVIAAADRGADFIRLGPIHALPIRETNVKSSKASPLGTPSPYVPSSRVAIDPIYLRIEDVPEIGHVPAAQREAIQSLGRGWGRPNAAAEPIPRAKVLGDKLAALRILYSMPPTPTRRRLFADFCRQAPESLKRWALMSAAAAHYATGRNPDAWREKMPHPHSRKAAEFSEEHRTDVEFWLWTQFLAVEQLRQVKAVAAQVGMRVGLITDIAPGISAEGGDWWAGLPGEDADSGGQSLYLDGIERRDGSASSGDAALRPWNPHLLAADGYTAVRDMLRTAAAGAGAISIERFSSLGRQRWAVTDAEEDAWAEVDLGSEAIDAVLALESERLGLDILSTTSVWEDPELRHSFADGTAPVETIAVLTPPTHTPLASYINLGDIEAAQKHKALDGDVHQLTSDARTARQEVLKEAAELGALAPTETMVGTIDEPWPVVAGLHTYLGQLNAAYLGASLMDIVGQEAPPHIPGAGESHPNWSVVLQDANAQAVLIEELDQHPGFAQIANTLSEQVSGGLRLEATEPAAGFAADTGSTAADELQADAGEGASGSERQTTGSTAASARTREEDR